MAGNPADKGWLLIFYTVMLLLASVGNQLFFKKQINAMPNYNWFLNLIAPAVFVCIFWAIVGCREVLSGMKQCNMIVCFAIMGLFDALSSLFGMLGGVHTSGSMQVLLQQATIPFTILMSVIFLRRHFHCVQHLGAFIIVVGIVWAKVLADTGGAVELQANWPLFNLLFLLSNVPQAASAVYKEIAMKGVDGFDVNVLQFWVSVFQLLGTILMVPVYTLSFLGPEQVPFDQMHGRLVGGWRCLFFRQDTVITNCGMPGQNPCDHCEDAWIPVLGYLAFNLSYNVFCILVIKSGSAALCFLVSTLRMPLASVAFSMPLFMGKDAEDLQAKDAGTLVMIIFGLLIYRHGGTLLKRELKVAGIREPMLVPANSPNMPSPGSSPPPSPPRSPRQGLAEMLRTARRGKLAFRPLFSTGLPLVQPSFVLLRDKIYKHISPPSSPNVRVASPPAGEDLPEVYLDPDKEGEAERGAHLIASR